MSLGHFVGYHIPFLLELAVRVSYELELGSSQSHIPTLAPTLLLFHEVSRRPSGFIGIHYLKYYGIKNLRKEHTEHDITSSRCSLGTPANTCLTHLVVSRLQTPSDGGETEQVLCPMIAKLKSSQAQTRLKIKRGSEN